MFNDISKTDNLKTIKISAVCAVIQVLLVGVSDAARVTLSNNYILDYELTNSNRSIDFKIQAINVTGWVGIGVNNGSASMYGSDIFIGGFAANNRSGYGNDYHVPRNTTIRQPILDRVQNWRVINATENNRTTTIHVTRLLNTGDTTQDLVIENKVMQLLWSYNVNSDNVTAQHTQRGTRALNLVATGGGGGGTPPTTPTTTTTRRSITNSTSTPPANSTAPIGAPIVNAKICIVTLSIWTSSLWLSNYSA